jgi:predicted transcriptional regulator
MINTLAKKFLTTSEIAKNKGCTTQAIRKAISVKKIQVIRKGRMILVTHKDAVKKLGYLPEAN